MHFQKPQLIFSSSLPHPKKFGPSALLIFDQILLSRLNQFESWVKKFPASYAVQAGEKLKDLNQFPKHVSKILTLADQLSTRDLVIVVAGGGSVGDFGGFVASILKRGVKLVQIPTTWLSALDSAHGGKTALNVDGIKNQIGTFYSASQIFLVRSALFAQGDQQSQDAFGELAKIALIDRDKIWKTLPNCRKQGADLIWQFLPHAIQAKYKIVKRDPFEKKGIRQVLNLGHTAGHVIEAAYQLPHGSSVAQGLLFCLEWSYRKNLLKKSRYQEISHLFSEKFHFKPLQRTQGFRPLPKKTWEKLLRSDKKRHSSSEVNYVFIQGFGKTPIAPVTLQSIIEEASRQGWARN